MPKNKETVAKNGAAPAANGRGFSVPGGGSIGDTGTAERILCKSLQSEVWLFLRKCRRYFSGVIPVIF